MDLLHKPSFSPDPNVISGVHPFKLVFNKSFDNDLSFLKYFQKKGCYLDDLSLSPVNKLSLKQRSKTLENSIRKLSKRIDNYNPDVIVIVLKKIDKYVRKAINLSNVSCPVYTLPFPGNGHQNKFVQKFSEILKVHIKDKT